MTTEPLDDVTVDAIINFDRPTNITALAVEVRDRRAQSRAVDQAIERAGLSGSLTHERAVDALREQRDEARAQMAEVQGQLSQARMAERDSPIPLLLHCPVCHTRHVDEGSQATTPHRTHACQNPRCGHLWAPAVVPTVGVWTLPGCLNPTLDTSRSALLGEFKTAMESGGERCRGCGSLVVQTDVTSRCNTCRARSGYPPLVSTGWTPLQQRIGDLILSAFGPPPSGDVAALSKTIAEIVERR